MEHKTIDNQSLAIGVLGITATILLAALLLINVFSQPAHALGTSDRGGDYALVTGQITDSREGLWVIDTRSNRLLLYMYDINARQVVPTDSFDLARLVGQ